MRGPGQKMDCFLLLSPQLICCVTFLLIKFVPVTNASPFLSTNTTDSEVGNTRTAHNEQLKPHHTYMYISETANFHIQPTNIKQITPTKVTNLIAASTEAIMSSKSETNHQHHRHQHKHRHMTQNLKGSKEYRLHQSTTAFTIQPTPTQVQPTQTKATYFSDTNSIMTSIPTSITFTEVVSDFPKLFTSSTMKTSRDAIQREMTSMFPKDFKITTATSIETRTSIIPVVHLQTDPPESSTQQQTSTNATSTNATSSMTTTFNNLTYQTTTQSITILKNLTLQTNSSTAKHMNLETTLKTMISQVANTTEQSTRVDTQTVLNESSLNQVRKTLSSEAMVNKTTTSFFIRPTPSTDNLLTRPLKTKFKPSHLNSPSKQSTQRPTRNIISLDERIQSRLRSSKSSTSPRSGLLHLTEDDPPTSHAYKPVMTNKKGSTSLQRNSNGRFLAAVTTEFMKSSEMIPDLFVAPTKTHKTHPTRSPYEGQGGGGGGGGGGVLTAISSVTAALSFRSKDEPLILSATATLNPSRMTYTCTIPCSQPDCTCCQDKQLAPATATKAVTGQPPSNATPNIEVSTNKSLTEQISLSAKFGIGMGCLIAIWLVVGPVICLICRIRDKVKEGEENVDGIGERKKKKKLKENSTSIIKEHPLTEAIVMDELNKQFSKKKTTRENEYLLLAKDKAELECLSRSDISKTITSKPMSTFDRTRSPHCLNRWDESDIEDDSEEDDDEKNRLSPLSNTPTVSV